jgi:capsid portal protein
MNYGQDNLYPQFIIEMWNKSAILRTGLLAKITAVKGNGLEPTIPGQEQLLEYANTEESFNEIWAKVVQDYEIFGGFCVNVIWSNDASRIAALYHVDFSKVRSGVLDRETDRVEYYWVSSDWTRYKKAEWKPKAYHRYDPNAAKEFPSQILYFFNHNPGQIFYGLPDWISAGTDVMSDVEISSYHCSHLKQGLTPSMIINMNNGDPGPIERQAIFEEIASSFSGTENSGKFFLSFNQSKETETSIQTIQPVGDDYYLQLEQRISSRVLSSLRITNPKICGLYLDTPGGLKNTTKDEMIVDYELFKQQVVIPDTKILLKPMNRLWNLMGGQGTLEVVPISLFPNQANLDPTTAPELVDNKSNEPTATEALV